MSDAIVGIAGGIGILVVFGYAVKLATWFIGKKVYVTVIAPEKKT